MCNITAIKFRISHFYSLKKCSPYFCMFLHVYNILKLSWCSAKAAATCDRAERDSHCKSGLSHNTDCSFTACVFRQGISQRCSSLVLLCPKSSSWGIWRDKTTWKVLNDAPGTGLKYGLVLPSPRCEECWATHITKVQIFFFYACSRK